MDPSALRQIPLFAALSHDQLAELAVYAREISAPSGAEIIREGDFAYEVLAIAEGEAHVFEGEDEVGRLGPGDVFGEIGVLSRGRRTASVTAATPVRLVSLTGWDMKRLARKAPEVFAQLRENMPGQAASVTPLAG